MLPTRSVSRQLVKMYRLATALAVMCVWIQPGSSGKAPSYMKFCKKVDPKLNECIKKSATDLVPYLMKGIREFAIPPLDPLPVYNISFTQGHSATAGIVVTAKRLTFYGLSGLNISSIRFDLKRNRLDVKSTTPFIRIEGPYVATGRILLLPFNGDGIMTLNITNCRIDAVFDHEIAIREGIEYLKLRDVKLKIPEIDFLSMDFTNLFDGNVLLGDTVRNFMNENWKEVFDEFKKSYEDILSEVAYVIGTNMFDILSYDDLFRP